MFVVIFRAEIKSLDDDYIRTAKNLRDLALTQFGCLKFEAVTEGASEITTSYWSTERDILAWKQHPDHLSAQNQGRDRWYKSYSVEVCEVKRQYQYNL